MIRLVRTLPLFLLGMLALAAPAATAQDQVHAGTNQGNQRIRLASADFKPVGNDAQTPALKATFDATLANDLARAGIFDMVAKSLQPQALPGSQQEIVLKQWSSQPANAAMVAFGALAAQSGRLVVYGFLDDAQNAQNPLVFSKQYNETASDEMARTVAHRFADEIINRLGGGIAGIAESKIYFVSSRSGSKEIWAMDYDGQNQHQITHLGSISISPRVSPDGSRIAFASLSSSGWAIRMYSVELGRVVAFPAGTGSGTNVSPSWSADGTKVAFSSSRTGDPEIYVANASGSDLHRVTTFHGPDVSPTWNPKTNAQIAWVSGRTGLPQIYTMSEDGTNVQRVTDGGYAVSPSWSPNGQSLVFSWNRKYGPGDPGGVDIHVIDLTTKNYLQITHESGSNDFPCWAPDGRHIVFERTIGKRTDIWTMLADGTDQHQLTRSGNNFMPNWSVK